MFKTLKKLFAKRDERSEAIKYLEEAHDRVDLEWRMRQLELKGIRNW